MATSKSGVLVPGAATAVTIDAPQEILIINVSQSGVLWVRADGTDATIRGDNCLAVLGQRTIRKRGSVSVSLISERGLEFSVEGVQG